MDIEQIKPNEPKFGLIVGISCVVIIVILAVACLFLKFDGKRLIMRHQRLEPNATLSLPLLHSRAYAALAEDVS